MAQKKGRNPLVWIVMGLLFVGLLGFGTGNIGGTITNIGRVGDKELRVSDYQRALNQQMRAFQAQTGTTLTMLQAQDFGLAAQAQAQLITERVIDNEAAQLGISVGDELVRREVLSVPGFRGLSGEFDREVYRSALRQNGLTEADFEAGIREEISRTLVQGAIAGGLPQSEIYASAIVEFLGSQRDIVWAEVTEDALIEPIPGATDAQLRAFYDENPDLFTAPEARDITYAWLTPTMIQDQLTIDEEALRATYDDRINEFVSPERRLVERLGFLDQAAADEARARLDAGEIDFDGLVAERGLDLADVDLGDVAEADLGAAAAAIFGASAGDVVGPEDSAVGPALFRMNAVLSAQETPFEEAEPLLREELAASRARRVIDDSAEQINDLLAGGATLEVLAERSDMELGQINWTVDSRDVIAAYDAFRTMASTMTEDAFPELGRLSDGGIFAMRVNGVAPPALIPFDEVQDEVREAYADSAKRSAIQERAEAIAADLGPLGDLASFGLTATIETGLTRRSFVEGTPPGFMTEVFEMEAGTSRVIDNGRSAIVVRVDAANSADLTDPQLAAELETVAETATAGIASDLYGVYVGAVQRRTDITLDQAALNAVHQSVGP